MTPPDPSLFGGIINALGTGLPHLLVQFVLAVVLLAAGVAIYIAATPFRERELIEEGNTAAGVMLGGAIVAMAIPIAATLATSWLLLDIVVWGAVAVLLQLLTIVAVSLLFRRFRVMIQQGNVAAALAVVATQLAISLLNAAVMIPN